MGKSPSDLLEAFLNRVDPYQMVVLEASFHFDLVVDLLLKPTSCASFDRPFLVVQLLLPLITRYFTKEATFHHYYQSSTKLKLEPFQLA
jgi:hypothetical protein